jgi:hypothetical protein
MQIRRPLGPELQSLANDLLMPHIPEFMIRYREYCDDKERLRTLADWTEFNRKWFVGQGWPEKSRTPEECYSAKNPNRFQAGARSWFRVFHSEDITPEARYEMDVTSATIGLPLVFPNGIHVPDHAQASWGWSQECPFDEISTTDLGADVCPLCARKLIYRWTGD